MVVAETIVDEEDYLILAQSSWRWLRQQSSPGYAYRSVYLDGKKKALLLHRHLLGLTWRDGWDGEHRNGNTLDNRRCNIRIASRSENMQNMIGRRRKARSSEHRGVGFDLRSGRWRAFAGTKGSFVHIGYFLTESEAAMAVLQWRQQNMPYSEMDQTLPVVTATFIPLAHRTAKPRPGRSVFRGVVPGTNGKWRSKFKGIWLGTFDSEEEAARAYDRAALAEWGPLCHQNFPSYD